MLRLREMSLQLLNGEYYSWCICSRLMMLGYFSQQQRSWLHFTAGVLVMRDLESMILLWRSIMLRSGIIILATVSSFHDTLGFVSAWAGFDTRNCIPLNET